MSGRLFSNGAKLRGIVVVLYAASSFIPAKPPMRLCPPHLPKLNKSAEKEQIMKTLLK